MQSLSLHQIHFMYNNINNDDDNNNIKLDRIDRVTKSYNLTQPEIYICIYIYIFLSFATNLTF